jgi:cell division protein FtsB
VPPLARRPTAVSIHGRFNVPSVKQQKVKLEKLTAKIQTRQQELTTLRAQQKELKTQLADAKKAEKEKAKPK